LYLHLVAIVLNDFSNSIVSGGTASRHINMATMFSRFDTTRINPASGRTTSSREEEEEDFTDRTVKLGPD
jgi:hypothetical protein